MSAYQRLESCTRTSSTRFPPNFSGQDTALFCEPVYILSQPSSSFSLIRISSGPVIDIDNCKTPRLPKVGRTHGLLTSSPLCHGSIFILPTPALRLMRHQTHTSSNCCPFPGL